MSFKPEWNRYYGVVPGGCYTFGFVDPAISQNKHSDYTSFVAVSIDYDGTWWVRAANKYKLNPTQIVEKMFTFCKEFDLMVLGIETQGYQEAILSILDHCSRESGIVLPVKGIKRGGISKHTRILSLVPRMEWARLFLKAGLTDLEDELASFPRGHDDILDALSSISEIMIVPQRKVRDPNEQPNTTDPNYEAWYIRQLGRQQVSNDEPT